MGYNDRFKITALKDVKILADVLIEVTDRSKSGTVIKRPGHQTGWIDLQEGETKDGLIMVHGVHPDCMPNLTAFHDGTFSFVSSGSWISPELPKDFFGLYRLEVSAVHE
jgi:hypothetical protein